MSQTPDSVVTPTLKDVQLTLAQLDAAIIGHGKWLTEWNIRIICGIPVEEKYIAENAYKESYFGRWYYDEHASFICHDPAFTAIEELHRRVHSGMRDIVLKIKRGETVSRDEYEAFIEYEASFTEVLVDLRDGLYKLQLSFDYLTGALNRQAFFHLLEQEYSRVTRFNEPGCVVLLDIDHFKDINDRYGHAAGDITLTTIASFLIQHMRTYDSICRYGGEEFLICMPKTTVGIAYNIIDRIRAALSRKKIAVSNDTHITVSASFGIASLSADEALPDTIEHADRALYMAKSGGRNRVEVWGLHDTKGP